MTAPLRFALVPVEPTDAMCGSIEYGAASRICETTLSERQYFLQKAIAASPGNDLLERIVRARDIAGSCQHGTPEWLNAVDEIYLVLNELGRGHG